MDIKIIKGFVDKVNRPLLEVNRILRDSAGEGLAPEIYVIKNSELLGEGVQVIEINIAPNPHYSEWTKLHIDFCRTFPKASAFQKIWYPTSVLVAASVQMWWHCNVYARFWNSKLRHRLGLKHPSDGDC